MEQLVEVKFKQDRPEPNPAKVYKGRELKNWPRGIYLSKTSGLMCVKFHERDDLALCLREDESALEGTLSEPYVRISENPRIVSITFAGSMNYPDGKPEGGSL